MDVALKECVEFFSEVLFSQIVRKWHYNALLPSFWAPLIQLFAVRWSYFLDSLKDFFSRWKIKNPVFFAWSTCCASFSSSRLFLKAKVDGVGASRFRTEVTHQETTAHSRDRAHHLWASQSLAPIFSIDLLLDIG